MTIELILLITKLNSKSLERSIGNMDAKDRKLFDVFNKVLCRNPTLREL
jgi:hypothetical protein